MDHKYWAYIVSSASGTLYIGMTNNIERRMTEHKSGHFEGVASKYGCNRLVFLESFAVEEDCADRIGESPLARSRREVGSAGRVCERVDHRSMSARNSPTCKLSS